VQNDPAARHALSDEQTVALHAVQQALGNFHSFLLEGVTGSGKTEVYLRLIAAVLARGENALLLCPEIGLTPQLLSRLRARFDVPLAALHSGLTDSERLQAWREAASGRARIVIGTRSAVFGPIPRLGVIVIDEEHDSSFKQHEGGFRYSARDLAVVRAQRCNVPVLLGSATPSFESLHNVDSGRSTRLSLPRRAGSAAPPTLRLVDLRAHPVQRGFSLPLLQAMQRHLDAGGQVLVFINRRGYAPTLLCSGCGWTAPCKHCDARLTVHQREQRLSCHHCGAEQPMPTTCPRCGHALRPLGHGTERVEETLGELFPGLPLARFDRDSVRGQADLEAAIDRVHSGEARLLVGTQMLTKGHHFPDVTLVAVLNADQSLFSTDFRAAERLAQTLVQVAGRAGREGRAGEVLMVKTHKWSDKWGIPGGKIQWGETSPAALRREIREETGLKVADIQFVLAQDCVRSKEFYRDAHFILLNYTCRVVGRSEVTLNHEAQAFRWVTLAAAKKLKLNRPTRTLLAAVLKKNTVRRQTSPSRKRHV
jgi:primosomal protein N' (replication factor Y)